ncbi:hypothetical protein DF156_19235 [Burkholderia ubonensis]|nr:hypothetical protein CJO66_12815 [Burkholderia ubonensis]RQP38582.1 hypothetical protein DF156_19235 [Burkholderia ubonensis]RQP39593.1 hypothetical protein DF155_06900 [Burkholderia ubonensis]RQP39892.1 hypothetical protein DF154_14675 [Burkholderia ubonensis]RQP52938.1 hypothetical protein DF144_17950 [Burkholderia ubonensis]
MLCEVDDGKEAICTSLSPFDAMLGAVFSSRPEKRYYAIHASDFDPSVFIADNSDHLRLSFHLGWPARDGKLIARRNGSPMTFAITQQMAVPPECRDRIVFTPNQGVLDCVDRLYESAGLEEYTDDFAMVNSWPKARQDLAVAQALRRMGRLAPAGTEFNQLALYDPASAQWQFVATEPVFNLHRQIYGGSN